MEDMRFATLRLGKTSVDEIKRMDKSSPGIVATDFNISVKCTQVPPDLNSGTYSFSSEMSGAINQVLNYKDSLTKEFYSLQSKSSPQFEVFNPKCVVIIGRISAMDVDEVAAFERFRNSLNNVTVVTFDELYTRITGLITTLSNK